MTTPIPTLDVERELIQQGATAVAGMDEVGRGALAGPVSVGVVVVNALTGQAPEKLRDSKAISASVRRKLIADLDVWSLDYAVGHSSNREIDSLGIVRALQLAGLRALSSLSTFPDALVLDGAHDWLSASLDVDMHSAGLSVPLPQVITRVRADQTCASVAAASVFAKVTRDTLMEDMGESYPHYCWGSNKGYGSAAHLAAIREYGPCELHRTSWHLPARDPDAIGASGP